jgi:HSP20 family molecular chaperone IbpA
MSLIPRSFLTGFDDSFFGPSPFMDDILIRPTLLNDEAGGMIRRSSPMYEISESDKQFQVALDVPGVPKENISIELLNHGRVVHVSGGRKVRKDNSYSETKFDQSFTVGSNVDASKLTAHLQDGVLVLTAPKKTEEANGNRKISIEAGPAPMLEDKKPEAEKKETRGCLNMCKM